MDTRTPILTTLTLACALAHGGPIEMTIDPAQSVIDLTMTVDVGIASDSDSDSSTLSGTLEIELDDAGSPTQIVLNDLMIVIDDDLAFHWSFGFLGGADAALSSGSVSYAGAGQPTVPAPVTAGAFVIPDVPVALAGTLDVSYSILVVGSGSQVVDLSDQGAFVADVSGSVNSDGSTVTLTSTIPLEGSVPLMDDAGTQLGTLTVSGSATIVATGDAPSCRADLNGDGALDFFDISAFLGAFTAQDPIADFDSNGVYNFFDISLFLNAFTSGCP